MKLILTSYDFSQNQIVRPVLHTATSAPSGVEGQLYYNSTSGIKVPYFHNGTSWTSFGTVTNVTLTFTGNASSIFDVNSGNSASITSTGTFDLTLNTQSANTILAGPTSGGASAPSFRALVLADIPSLSTLYLPLAGGTMAGTINMNNNIISNLGTPSSSGDAVNKNYVDSLLDGRKWKQAVLVATTANITLSGTQTIDGVALAVNDRVLVKDQTTQSQNGIYSVQSGAWTRTTDADIAVELEGASVTVLSGTANMDKSFYQTTFPVTLGSSNIVWVLASSSTYSADGHGIELTGNTFGLELDGGTLTKGGSGLKVSDGGITGTQLNTSVAGNGLTGGGGSALAVGAGTGITVAADSISVTGYTPITSWEIAKRIYGSFTVTTAGAFSQNISVGSYPGAGQELVVFCKDSGDNVIELDVDTTVSGGNIVIAGVAPTNSYQIKYTIIA